MSTSASISFDPNADSGPGGGGLVGAQRAEVVTGADGNATWVFPTPFAAAPHIQFSIGPTADAAALVGRISALSASEVTINVRRSPSVTVLGIEVLAFPGPAAGMPVQVLAYER